MGEGVSPQLTLGVDLHLKPQGPLGAQPRLFPAAYRAGRPGQARLNLGAPSAQWLCMRGEAAVKGLPS